MDLFNSILAFVQAGFNDMRTNVMAVVIAFIVAFFVMKKWGQLIFMTIGATLVHLLVVAFVKPLLDGGDIGLPPIMDPEYWKVAAGLAVGYLIAIIFLFFIKNNVFRLGHGHGGGH